MDDEWQYYSPQPHNEWPYEESPFITHGHLSPEGRSYTQQNNVFGVELEKRIRGFCRHPERLKITWSGNDLIISIAQHFTITYCVQSNQYIYLGEHVSEIVAAGVLLIVSDYDHYTSDLRHQINKA